MRDAIALAFWAVDITAIGALLHLSWSLVLPHGLVSPPAAAATPPAPVAEAVRDPSVLDAVTAPAAAIAGHLQVQLHIAVLTVVIAAVVGIVLRLSRAAPDTTHPVVLSPLGETPPRTPRLSDAGSDARRSIASDPTASDTSSLGRCSPATSDVGTDAGTPAAASRSATPMSRRGEALQSPAVTFGQPPSQPSSQPPSQVSTPRSHSSMGMVGGVALSNAAGRLGSPPLLTDVTLSPPVPDSSQREPTLSPPTADAASPRASQVPSGMASPKNPRCPTPPPRGRSKDAKNDTMLAPLDTAHAGIAPMTPSTTRALEAFEGTDSAQGASNGRAEAATIALAAAERIGRLEAALKRAAAEKAAAVREASGERHEVQRLQAAASALVGEIVAERESHRGDLELVVAARQRERDLSPETSVTTAAPAMSPDAAVTKLKKMSAELNHSRAERDALIHRVSQLTAQSALDKDLLEAAAAVSHAAQVVEAEERRASVERAESVDLQRQLDDARSELAHHRASPDRMFEVSGRSSTTDGDRLLRDAMAELEVMRRSKEDLEAQLSASCPGSADDALEAKVKEAEAQRDAALEEAANTSQTARLAAIEHRDELKYAQCAAAKAKYELEDALSQVAIAKAAAAAEREAATAAVSARLGTTDSTMRAQLSDMKAQLEAAHAAREASATQAASLQEEVATLTAQMHRMQEAAASSTVTTSGTTTPSSSAPSVDAATKGGAEDQRQVVDALRAEVQREQAAREAAETELEDARAREAVALSEKAEALHEAEVAAAAARAERHAAGAVMDTRSRDAAAAMRDAEQRRHVEGRLAAVQAELTASNAAQSEQAASLGRSTAELAAVTADRDRIAAQMEERASSETAADGEAVAAAEQRCAEAVAALETVRTASAESDAALVAALAAEAQLLQNISALEVQISDERRAASSAKEELQALVAARGESEAELRLTIATLEAAKAAAVETSRQEADLRLAAEEQLVVIRTAAEAEGKGKGEMWEQITAKTEEAAAALRKAAAVEAERDAIAAQLTEAHDSKAALATVQASYDALIVEAEKLRSENDTAREALAAAAAVADTTNGADAEALQADLIAATALAEASREAMVRAEDASEAARAEATSAEEAASTLRAANEALTFELRTTTDLLEAERMAARTAAEAIDTDTDMALDVNAAAVAKIEATLAAALEERDALHTQLTESKSALTAAQDRTASDAAERRQLAAELDAQQRALESASQCSDLNAEAAALNAQMAAYLTCAAELADEAWAARAEHYAAAVSTVAVAAAIQTEDAVKRAAAAEGRLRRYSAEVEDLEKWHREAEEARVASVEQQDRLMALVEQLTPQLTPQPTAQSFIGEENDAAASPGVNGSEFMATHAAVRSELFGADDDSVGHATPPPTRGLRGAHEPRPKPSPKRRAGAASHTTSRSSRSAGSSPSASTSQRPIRGAPTTPRGTRTPRSTGPPPIAAASETQNGASNGEGHHHSAGVEAVVVGAESGEAVRNHAMDLIVGEMDAADGQRQELLDLFDRFVHTGPGSEGDNGGAPPPTV